MGPGRRPSAARATGMANRGTGPAANPAPRQRRPRLSWREVRGQTGARGGDGLRSVVRQPRGVRATQADRGGRTAAAPPAPRAVGEQPYATGSALVVEHDAARLDYDGRLYRLTMRRRLRNTGTEPVTRYLIRISDKPLPRRARAGQRALPHPPPDLGGAGAGRDVPRRGGAMGGQARPRRLQGGLAAVRERPGPLPALPRRVGVNRVRVLGGGREVGPVVPAGRTAAHRAPGGPAGVRAPCPLWRGRPGAHPHRRPAQPPAARRRSRRRHRSGIPWTPALARTACAPPALRDVNPSYPPVSIFGSRRRRMPGPGRPGRSTAAAVSRSSGDAPQA